jgi:molecular chaperone DnaJ
MQSCNTCGGSGIKPGVGKRGCGSCNGQGQVASTQRTPFGVMQSVQPCNKCGGTGQDASTRCTSCRGSCCVQTTAEVNLKIPGGVENGARLCIKGGGDDGKNFGPAGDLYVKLIVKSDPKFRREGANVFSNATISYLDAILGTVIAISGVDGETFKVNIPPGTQPDQKLAVKEKGVLKFGSVNKKRGDHIICVKVSIPKTLSEHEKNSLLNLRSKSEGSPEVSS